MPLTDQIGGQFTGGQTLTVTDNALNWADTTNIMYSSSGTTTSNSYNMAEAMQ